MKVKALMDEFADEGDLGMGQNSFAVTRQSIIEGKIDGISAMVKDGEEFVYYRIKGTWYEDINVFATLQEAIEDQKEWHQKDGGE